MKKDNVMLRLPCIFGPQWLQAYALVDLVPGIDPMEFRFELPKRLDKFHEVENYLGGSPGHLFVGFFAHGQGDLLKEIAKIKAMEEVLVLKEWAIANFPVGNYELAKDDWTILRHLRGGNVTPELAFWFKPDPQTMARIAAGEAPPHIPVEQIERVAGETGLTTDRVMERLEFMKSIPLGVMLQDLDDGVWNFTEIHFSFHNCTFDQKAPELMKIGRPFPAESHLRQGGLMIETETLDDLKQAIKQTSQIPGVRVVDFAFSEDMLWTQPWLDDFIEEMLKRI